MCSTDAFCISFRFYCIQLCNTGPKMVVCQEWIGKQHCCGQAPSYFSFFSSLPPSAVAAWFLTCVDCFGQHWEPWARWWGFQLRLECRDVSQERHLCDGLGVVPAVWLALMWPAVRPCLPLPLGLPQGLSSMHLFSVLVILQAFPWSIS